MPGIFFRFCGNFKLKNNNVKFSYTIQHVFIPSLIIVKSDGIRIKKVCIFKNQQHTKT